MKFSPKFEFDIYLAFDKLKRTIAFLLPLSVICFTRALPSHMSLTLTLRSVARCSAWFWGWKVGFRAEMMALYYTPGTRRVYLLAALMPFDGGTIHPL